MLAIIPARGGSKGLPRKNIRSFCGKPLIAWTIEQARTSKKIQKVVVSTDDPEIAEISRQFGADIPFLRPAALATDTSLAIDTYIYTMERLKAELGLIYPNFVVLQATSPLRTTADIDAAIELFYAQDADSVISLVPATHPPLWSKQIDNSGIIRDYFDVKDIGLKNRQELPKAYIPNGAIFIFRYVLIQEKRVYYTASSFPYLMPRERSVDIDDLVDFEFAEFLMRKQLAKA